MKYKNNWVIEGSDDEILDVLLLFFETYRRIIYKKVSASFFSLNTKTFTGGKYKVAFLSPHPSKHPERVLKIQTSSIKRKKKKKK